jgi:hypothetical protein
MDLEEKLEQIPIGRLVWVEDDFDRLSVAVTQTFLVPRCVRKQMA